MELLSEDSLSLSSLRKLFEGSSIQSISVIMPDLDASGKKDPADALDNQFKLSDWLG